MTTITRDGIEYNFDITPYRTNISYGKLILQYRFSSKLYQEKFQRLHLENKSKTYPLNSNMEIFDDINGYAKIEKRGFLINKDGIYFLNIKDIKLYMDFTMYK